MRSPVSVLALAMPAVAETHGPEVVLLAARAARTTTSAGPAAAAELVGPAGVTLIVVASILQGLNREFRECARRRRLAFGSRERRAY